MDFILNGLKIVALSIVVGFWFRVGWELLAITMKISSNFVDIPRIYRACCWVIVRLWRWVRMRLFELKWRFDSKKTKRGFHTTCTINVSGVSVAEVESSLKKFAKAVKPLPGVMSWQDLEQYAKTQGFDFPSSLPNGTMVCPGVSYSLHLPGVTMAEVSGRLKDFAKASRPIHIKSQEELELHFGSMGDNPIPQKRIETMNTDKSKGPWTIHDMACIAREQIAALIQVPKEVRPAEMRDSEFCWHPSYSDQAFIAVSDDLKTVKVMWTDGEIAEGYLQFDLKLGEPVIVISDEDQEKFDMHGTYTLDGEEV